MATSEVRMYDSFAAAEAAELEYYRSLSPQQRMDILLDLVARYRESLDEAEQRFARVHRVVGFGKR
jgi:hypothetical protein